MIRIPYKYPTTEEPFAEVNRAIELDNFHEERWKQKMSKTDQALINKYRPISFEEVIGNKLVIQQLDEAIKSSTCPHAFLFTGESGIGKTTLARIIASKLDSSIEYIDAAVNSGVAETKNVIEATQFCPILGKAKHLLIIDECHNLSKAAQTSLLSLVEEPPDYLYIALCTTDKQKLLDTIINRCYKVPLKPLKVPEIELIIQTIADIEEWKVENDVFNAICTTAFGSARKAITILQAGHSLKTREELAQVVEDVESEDDAIFQLCSYIMKGGRAWIQISKLLERIEDPEEDLMKACRFFANKMPVSQEEQAKQIYRYLRAFTDTSFSWDKKVQLYSAVGKILWGEVPF